MAQGGRKKKARQSRKRRRSRAGEDAPPSGPPAAPSGAGPNGRDTGNAAARPPSRSERKDAAARAGLVPLREGERPRAVTVGAVAAALLAIGNLAAYAAGFEVNGERPPFAAIAIQAALMLTAAWGMWRARYWAVLGMEAILGILILLMALSAMTASNALGVIVPVAIIVPAAVLFWLLVKAMARIQMPERR